MQALSDGQQMERLESRVGGLGQRIDHIEGSLGGRIDHVETELGKRIDRVETKLGGRIDGVEEKLEGIRAESRADFRMLLGAILTMFAAMILGFGTLLLQHL